MLCMLAVYVVVVCVLCCRLARVLRMMNNDNVHACMHQDSSSSSMQANIIVCKQYQRKSFVYLCLQARLKKVRAVELLAVHW